MIFLTIIFITVALLHLFNINPLTKGLRNIGLEYIKLYESNDNPDENNKDEVVSLGVKALLITLILLLISIIELFYYIKALNIDVYKYPSIAMIIYTIIRIVYGVVKNKGKNNYNMKNAEDRIIYKYNLEKSVKYTFVQFIKVMIDVVYLSYMFYILVL